MRSFARLAWVALSTLVGLIVLTWVAIGRSAAIDALARRSAFMMVSGYGLYPPIDDSTDPASVALTHALTQLGERHISGIVYGTLGIAPQIAAKLPSPIDPNDYNKALFRSARKKGANLWLQLRYYDNQVELGKGPRNLTAPSIIGKPDIQAAFVAAAMDTVAVYQDAYPKTCTIILGEEETIYHSERGGGLFWAGENLWNESLKKDDSLKESKALDKVFADRFAAINQILIARIRQAYPSCRIGVHIGHAALYRTINNRSVYQVILEKMPPLDFTFYDLYEKISKTDADFVTKLEERIKLLKQLGQTVYYLAQIHTTNNFGHGGGRAPSKEEINMTFCHAKDLGVIGFGYYTKNAVPTRICTVAGGECTTEDLDPLDPNSTGQEMVYQNSLVRWKYGLSKLSEFLGETP
jgi:hypothetical protein